MSSTALDQAPLDALGTTLRRQLDVARERAQALQERRRQLEGELHAVRAAQAAAQESVAALEAVAAQAAGLLADFPRRELRAVSQTHEPGAPMGRRALAGAQLREMVVRVALRQDALGQPVHWREWYYWFQEAGFEAAGKKPEATFQTQLARSPLVRRSAQQGVYLLAVEAVREAQGQLQQLHDQLGQLPAPGQSSLLEGFDEDARERRRALQSEIARTERHLAEMIRVLSQEPPPGATGLAGTSPYRVVEAWLSHSRPDPDQPALG